jgi:PKHD-type hydroxylase
VTDSRGFATSPVLTGALVAWDGLFNAADLAAIEKHGDSLAHRKAELSGSAATDAIRVTRVAWFGRDARTEGFYRRMEEAVLALNGRFFRYDLSGLVDFQYAIYDGSEGGHFDWHKDYGRAYGAESQEPRKLTLSLQLSDGADYDGCELQVRSGNEIDIAPKTRGSLVAFPAYVLHRVTPVTRGVRKSLVIWAAGPEFR